MKKTLPKSAKDIKGKVAIAELRRAHYIIAMLAVMLALVLALTSTYEARPDAILSAIAIALLAIVAVTSLGTVIALNKLK
jgi:predicted membrane-bound dolichyl-phosphate-mannose-protein mannosyltransferase